MPSTNHKPFQRFSPLKRLAFRFADYTRLKPGVNETEETVFIGASWVHPLSVTKVPHVSEDHRHVALIRGCYYFFIAN
jgi:hypothetical protein